MLVFCNDKLVTEIGKLEQVRFFITFVSCSLKVNYNCYRYARRVAKRSLIVTLNRAGRGGGVVGTSLPGNCVIVYVREHSTEITSSEILSTKL